MTDLMSKDRLKNRMVVELYSGDRFMVVGNVLVGEKGCMPLKYYTEDLKLIGATEKSGDVFCVYNTRLYLNTKVDGEIPLWIRPKELTEIKEVTMTEVEEKFGCKVKIVKE